MAPIRSQLASLVQSGISTDEDVARRHKIEAEAWHKQRWFVVKLGVDDLPGLLRMWIEAEGKRRFG